MQNVNIEYIVFESTANALAESAKVNGNEIITLSGHLSIQRMHSVNCNLSSPRKMQ